MDEVYFKKEFELNKVDLFRKILGSFLDKPHTRILHRDVEYFTVSEISKWLSDKDLYRFLNNFSIDCDFNSNNSIVLTFTFFLRDETMVGYIFTSDDMLKICDYEIYRKDLL